MSQCTGEKIPTSRVKPGRRLVSKRWSKGTIAQGSRASSGSWARCPRQGLGSSDGTVEAPGSVGQCNAMQCYVVSRLLFSGRQSTKAANEGLVSPRSRKDFRVSHRGGHGCISLRWFAHRLRSISTPFTRHLPFHQWIIDRQQHAIDLQYQRHRFKRWLHSVGPCPLGYGLLRSATANIQAQYGH